MKKIILPLSIILILIFIVFSIFKNNSSLFSFQEEEKSIGSVMLETSLGDISVNAAYQFENDTVVRENSDYRITYFSETQEFLITFQSVPVEVARKKAEKGFLETLRVSKKEACKLSVKMVITYDIDPDLAGQEFPLSFCE